MTRLRKSHAVERAAIVFIPVQQLLFDRMNPRIAPMPETATQAECAAKLRYLGLTELLRSLKAHGYLPYEPAIVRRAAEGGYVVLEGNRRLAAILALPSVNRPHTIPCMIVDQATQWLALGASHLTGKRRWPPYQQALFLERCLQAQQIVAAWPADAAWNACANLLTVSVGRAKILYRALGLFRQVCALDPAKARTSWSFWLNCVAGAYALLPVIGWSPGGNVAEAAMMKKLLLWWFVRRRKRLVDLRDALHRWLMTLPEKGHNP